MKKKYFSLVFLLKNTKKILVGIKPPYLESLFLESKLMCMCLHINGLLVCFFDLENTLYFCCIPEMFECCTCVTCTALYKMYKIVIKFYMQILPTY